MEHNAWLLFGLGSSAAAAATWGVCHWWYTRQLVALRDRLDKIDKARLLSGQQVMQARKQIEKMQREMTMPKRQSASSPVAPSRAAHLEAVFRTIDDIPARGRLPQHGFADTQPADA